jgi:hypothetical protein
MCEEERRVRGTASEEVEEDNDTEMARRAQGTEPKSDAVRSSTADDKSRAGAFGRRCVVDLRV